MLTLFTSCKPFYGEDAVAQRNAINSWRQLRPEPEIMILGNDDGSKDVAEELGVRHVPDIERSKFGNPFITEIFDKSQRLAKYDICCYINADIILLDDFIRGVDNIASRKEKFLLVGGRYDLDINETLTFEAGWQKKLKKRSRTNGQLYHLPGMDYFVFRRGQFAKILPFVLGNIRWDNWMVYEARRNGIATIDGTNAITAIHQNHDMKHAEESGELGIKFDKAAMYNLELYGKGMTAFFYKDATHVLTKTGIKLALSSQYLKRRLVTTPVFHPKTARLCNLIRRMID